MLLAASSYLQDKMMERLAEVSPMPLHMMNVSGCTAPS